MTKENLIERIRKIPPTVAANLGYIWGVSEGIQAVDIIQSQSDIVRGAAYVAAGVALVGLNKYVISPVVEGIDKKLTGTKKRVGYQLASTASAACLVALLASQCATPPPKRVQEPFSYNDKYSPTPRHSQSVFDVNGENDADTIEGRTKIARAFNSWDSKRGNPCEETQAEQVMVSDEGEIYIRADCDKKPVSKVVDNKEGQSNDLTSRLAGEELCFPVAEDSYSRVSWNFGQRRSRKRCHTAIDIYTKNAGEVLAMIDGVVVGTRQTATVTGNYRTCKGEITGVLLVYNEKHDFTILYGEMDVPEIDRFSIGQKIKKGESLGPALNCGFDSQYPSMLHIGFSDGKIESVSEQRWNVPGIVKSSYECLEKKGHLDKMPKDLIDGTALLRSLEGHYCK